MALSFSLLCFLGGLARMVLMFFFSPSSLLFFFLFCNFYLVLVCFLMVYNLCSENGFN